MFSAIWIFGLNTSYYKIHSKLITTVVFGNHGPIETNWKKIFSIGRFGLYIKENYMGKVKVGEFEFDNLKEAQEYAAQLKADPNYVPPVKTEVNDGIVPQFDPQEPGPLDEATQESNDTQSIYAASSEASDVERVDLSDIADSLTDEDPELAEELDAILAEPGDVVPEDHKE